MSLENLGDVFSSDDIFDDDWSLESESLDDGLDAASEPSFSDSDTDSEDSK